MVDTLITKIAAHEWKKGLKLFWFCGGKWSGREDPSFLKFICTWMLFADTNAFPDSLGYLQLPPLYLPDATRSRKPESRVNLFIHAHTPNSLLCLPTSWPAGCCVSHTAMSCTLCFQESAHSHIQQQAGQFCHWPLLHLDVEEGFDNIFEPNGNHLLWKRNLPPICISRQVVWLPRLCKLLLIGSYTAF